MDGYGGAALTAQEREGRDAWSFWTAGNQKFWRTIAVSTRGDVDLLMYVDSRTHDRRFEALGVINDPGCRAAPGPDDYGLWMDDCSDGADGSNLPGQPIGIVGLRRFDNPAFDASRWSLDSYLNDRASVEPPYLVGMACGFCHIGFNPLNPPADPNRAAWSNLSPTIGNQYFEEGKLFSQHVPPSDFRWQVANGQPPGTSDTSRLATDHIDNPSAINPLFGLADRPTFPEKMRDGSTTPVPHVLKDGADSIGLSGAALRVFVNIGMCGEYSLTLHDAIDGVGSRQHPFDIEQARASCEDWRSTEARVPAIEAFLKKQVPPRLSDAPGGSSYLTSDSETLREGKLAFAGACAVCHSSKQPAADTADRQQWYRESVLADDFLTNNFLADDERHPVTVIGTNVARAVASNATRGHVWDQFSSETYKGLAPVGTLKGLYNPLDPKRSIDFVMPGGGRGYYRTPSLLALWATAPYLHNNSVGAVTKDPSVAARVAAFTDAVEKLLWPEKRPGIKAIPTTTTESVVPIPGTTKVLRVPAGTPIDFVARVDPSDLARVAAAMPPERLVLVLAPDDRLAIELTTRNLAPDFVPDRGHTFGATLSDSQKRALIEFLKTF
jgi:hypothetical protein